MRALFPDRNDLRVPLVIDSKRCQRPFKLNSENGKRSNQFRAAVPGNDNIAASYLEAGRFVVVRNLHLNTPSDTMEASGSSDCGPWRELESFSNICCAVKDASVLNVVSRRLTGDTRSSATSPCNTRASGVGR